jgi:LysR family glycine cleavage system transcriptional activator
VIRQPGRNGSRSHGASGDGCLIFADVQHLSFREELHAIEAVIAGQGVGIFSDILVAPELAAGTLVKAFDLPLPGYCFYVVRRRGHPLEKVIEAFAAWLQSVR